MQSNWHNLSWVEAIKILDSDIEKGLAEKEAMIRQKKLGFNELPKEKPLPKIKLFLEQLKSPLIYVLILAALITLFLREWIDFSVISGAIVLNTIVGYFQENKASKALKAMKQVVKVEAEIIRDGNEIKLDSKELVPGDIIVLTEGNKVPADARIFQSNNLKVNEASLTGEWLPAQKTTEILSLETSLADRDNMVYMGSIIEEGKGKAIVTSIGQDTEMGKLAVLVKETKEEKTPLQKKLARFSKFIGIIIGLICLAIFFEGVFKGRELLEMFTTSVAVAVAAIPEGLPVAMTVILALGMQRVLKRKGLVRKLAAAETLGSTSIVATDKTLTLTTGVMEVSQTITLASKVFGQKKSEWRDVFRHNFNQDQILLMKILTLTNEAFAENPEDSYPFWVVRGRPTDKALFIAGAEVGLRKQELEKAYYKIDELIFNSQNKFAAVLLAADPLFNRKEAKFSKDIKVSLIKDPLIHGADQALFVIGAPEKILEFSSCVQENGKERELKQDDLSQLNKELENLTKHGLRVIAAAYKKVSSSKTKQINIKDEIKDLTFVGLIGLKDPLREEAKEAIKTCQRAGLRPIMVTGDHLLTAVSIGRELGLKTGPRNIINGKDLDIMTEEEFQKRFKDIEIYARVEPRHKLKIVTAWQEEGEVVAMTGDGINDAPALKKADIGVSLGSGTDVAKEISDLVLLTDNFNVLIAAVEEGRVIIDNIRKVITYLLSDSFTETILIGASLILGWPLPVTAAQILWVNLIEDGLPDIALAFEPKEKDVLKRKPESRNIHLLTKEMKVIIFIIGLLTDFILLGLLWWLLKGNYDIEHIRTMVFACLGINSLFYVFSCKNLRKNIWQINPFSNLFLVAAWLIGILALISAVQAPVLQKLLATVPLNLTQWSIVVLLGLLNVIFIEAAKYYFIVKHQTER